VKSLRAQMDAAAADSRFEEAATRRDHIPRAGPLGAPKDHTTTSTSATSSVPTSNGTAGPCRFFSVREARCGPRGLPRPPRARPEQFPSSAIQQYYATGSATCRARCWSRRDPRPRPARDWLSARGGAGAIRSRSARDGALPRWSCATPARLSTSSGAIPGSQCAEILRGLQDLLQLEVDRGASSASTSRTSRARDVVRLHGGFEKAGQNRKYRKFRVRGMATSPTISPPWGGGGASIRSCSRRARSCPTSCSSTPARVSLRRHRSAGRAGFLGDQPVAQPGQARGADLFVFFPGPGGGEPVVFRFRDAVPPSVLQCVPARARRGAPVAIGFHRQTRSKRTSLGAGRHPRVGRQATQAGSRASILAGVRGRASKS